MKSRIALLLLGLLLFSSCIVKSLQPFYIQEALEFQDVFVGAWKGKNNARWEVSSIKEYFEAEKADTTNKITEDDIKQFNRYKEGYYLSYIKEKKKDTIENHFIAMPFKVKNEILIDFIPFYIESIDNSFPQQHLLKTHSVAKLEITNKKQVKLSFLDQSYLSDLYQQGKVKLKREIVGVEEDPILTASSEEIYKFLEKYLASDFKDEWSSSDTEYTLDKTGDTGNTFKVWQTKSN
ncbi:hypothetical protein [Winogradskyella immobilis]|uniref:Lipoprotein n=1 Tax=Winogradskyella immobilis TaxID=2816852 RepID=A0ABS8ELX6_9FLAO|nr:hypothetical protein [Winogradskyella immobilis]MCC1484216.1 hypothetical protein [Winogradskyella immobilis]MCG0016308.1 hypothetical protein [Winogradskyella immobilis]